MKELEKIEERVKGLEDRFYEECCYGSEDCHCGITENGPSAEVLFELILDNLGLKLEKQKTWTLKKK